MSSRGLKLGYEFIAFKIDSIYLYFCKFLTLAALNQRFDRISSFRSGGLRDEPKERLRGRLGCARLSTNCS